VETEKIKWPLDSGRGLFGIISATGGTPRSLSAGKRGDILAAVSPPAISHSLLADTTRPAALAGRGEP